MDRLNFQELRPERLKEAKEVLNKLLKVWSKLEPAR